MYLTNVEIRESKINGKGVFACEPIKKGTVVWKFDSNHDHAISVEEFDNLDMETQADLKRVAYLSPSTNKYVYPPTNDPARYTNHDVNNNNLSVVVDPKVSSEPFFVAKRDIKIGEELTNNYFEFDESLKISKPEWIK